MAMNFNPAVASRRKGKYKFCVCLHLPFRCLRLPNCIQAAELRIILEDPLHKLLYLNLLPFRTFIHVLKRQLQHLQRSDGLICCSRDGLDISQGLLLRKQLAFSQIRLIELDQVNGNQHTKKNNSNHAEGYNKLFSDA
ncbi:hypothetical protein D3C78_953430 [compost metagenome]